MIRHRSVFCSTAVAKIFLPIGAAAIAIAAAALPARAAELPACPGDSTGIVLSPGFCATVFADNLRAIRLYQRFGFEQEGVLRNYAFRAGAFADAHLMARLRG